MSDLAPLRFPGRVQRLLADVAPPAEPVRPPLELTAPVVADYEPALVVAHYARLALACVAGECVYDVVPGAKLRHPGHGWCRGWRGAVHVEDIGPVLRVRPCDRRLRYERQMRETRAAEKQAAKGKAVPESWNK